MWHHIYNPPHMSYPAFVANYEYFAVNKGSGVMSQLMRLVLHKAWGKCNEVGWLSLLYPALQSMDTIASGDSVEKEMSGGNERLLPTWVPPLGIPCLSSSSPSWNEVLYKHRGRRINIPWQKPALCLSLTILAYGTNYHDFMFLKLTAVGECPPLSSVGVM